MGTTPWHWSKNVQFRQSWLFYKGCLSLHSWWDAMLAHNGTYWDMLAFSLLHLSFIGTIASVVQQLFLSLVLTTLSFAGRRKAQLFFKWTKALMLALACACACEGLLGRSVADIMCIACIAVCIKCLALAPSCTIRPWTGLGRILERCVRNHRKTLVSSVYLCLFLREGCPRQTYIKQVGWKHGCKLMDQI